MELDYYWSRLGEGGEEGQCGWLKGQVRPFLAGDAGRTSGSSSRRTTKKKRGRVMKAMLSMKKIVIAELREAAEI